MMDVTLLNPGRPRLRHGVFVLRYDQLTRSIEHVRPFKVEHYQAQESSQRC